MNITVGNCNDGNQVARPVPHQRDDQPLSNLPTGHLFAAALNRAQPSQAQLFAATYKAADGETLMPFSQCLFLWRALLPFYQRTIPFLVLAYSSCCRRDPREPDAAVLGDGGLRRERRDGSKGPGSSLVHCIQPGWSSPF